MKRPDDRALVALQCQVIAAATARGCTQDAIATHLGVSRSTVDSWTRDGSPSHMKLWHVKGIAELACSPDVLAPLLPVVVVVAVPTDARHELYAALGALLMVATRPVRLLTARERAQVHADVHGHLQAAASAARHLWGSP